jgi:hypothetical protein
MITTNTTTSQQEKLNDIAEWESREDISIFMIPTYIYDYLVEFRKISPTTPEKNEAISKAADIRKLVLYNDSIGGRVSDINEYKKFMDQYNNGYFKEEMDRLKLIAKKILVIEYLNAKK